MPFFPKEGWVASVAVNLHDTHGRLSSVTLLLRISVTLWHASYVELSYIVYKHNQHNSALLCDSCSISLNENESFGCEVYLLQSYFQN